MTQKKNTTKKSTTKRKPAAKKADVAKSGKKTEATKPAVASTTGSTSAPKVWESPKPIVPQKKKNWFKRLFSWF